MAFSRVAWPALVVLIVPGSWPRGSCVGTCTDDPDTGPRAANERPITGWDPLSKQPIDKTAVAAVRLLDRDGQPSQAPTNTASAPRVAERREYRLPPAVLPPSPSRSSRERDTEPGGSPFLRKVHRGEAELERELHAVGERHATFHEVRYVTVDLPRCSLETGRRSPAATAPS